MDELNITEEVNALAGLPLEERVEGLDSLIAELERQLETTSAPPQEDPRRP